MKNNRKTKHALPPPPCARHGQSCLRGTTGPKCLEMEWFQKIEKAKKTHKKFKKIKNSCGRSLAVSGPPRTSASRPGDHGAERWAWRRPGTPRGRGGGSHATRSWTPHGPWLQWTGEKTHTQATYKVTTCREGAWPRRRRPGHGHAARGEAGNPRSYLEARSSTSPMLG